MIELCPEKNLSSGFLFLIHIDLTLAVNMVAENGLHDRQKYKKKSFWAIIWRLIRQVYSIEHKEVPKRYLNRRYIKYSYLAKPIFIW